MVTVYFLYYFWYYILNFIFPTIHDVKLCKSILIGFCSNAVHTRRLFRNLFDKIVTKLCDIYSY